MIEAGFLLLYELLDIFLRKLRRTHQSRKPEPPANSNKVKEALKIVSQSPESSIKAIASEYKYVHTRSYPYPKKGNSFIILLILCFRK